MFKEFKEFAMRGNVIDMAVGVMFGAAFGKIVSSAVADIVMPLVGLVAGKVDFKNMYVILSGPKGPFPTLEAAQAAGATTLNYGLFTGAIFDFLIIAFALCKRHIISATSGFPFPAFVTRDAQFVWFAWKTENFPLLIGYVTLQRRCAPPINL